MKKVAKIVGVSVAAAALLFLSGAFAAASFDISQWDSIGRLMLAYVWTAVTAGVVLYEGI